MLHIIKNIAAPSVLKAVLPASVFFSSLLSFSFLLPLYGGQAVQTLNDIACVSGMGELPVPAKPLVPGSAAVYTAAPGLNVYFLSVGQGDAEYIELPNGQNVLIDGGPFGPGPGSLAEFLSAKGVKKIDHVMLTHPHSDHYKGLPYIFSNFSVGNFYDTRMDNRTASGDNSLRDQIKKLGVKVTYPAEGDQLSWGPGAISAKVFNSCPKVQISSVSSSLNNCSIVFKLTYQNASVLFVGDAQMEVEDVLVKKYGSELKADALKVAHHGSRYSSTEPFLKAVRPAKAYIEVGENDYGHPTQAALSRLRAVGAAIYRTDLDGTQEYSADRLLPPQLAAVLR